MSSQVILTLVKFRQPQALGSSLVFKGPRPTVSTPGSEPSRLLGKGTCDIMKIIRLSALADLNLKLALSPVGCGNEQVTPYHLSFLTRKMGVVISKESSPSPFLVEYIWALSQTSLKVKAHSEYLRVGK